VVVNLIGMPLEERPQFFAQILVLCNKMCAETGRPHWLVVDQAHQMLHPILGDHIEPVWNEKGLGLAIVTVDPWQISPAILSSLDLIVAVGKEADKTSMHSPRLSIIETPSDCMTISDGGKRSFGLGTSMKSH